MGRGLLTTEEIRILKKNPYVTAVNGSRITYSEDFKRYFVREYFSGKKPVRIFEDAGFDVKILGNKRIERCSARWREANAAGSLGEKYENNDYYNKHENERMILERTIREQKLEIEVLKQEIACLQNKLQEINEQKG